MKIAVFAEASKVYGFGHLTRCSALAQALKKCSTKSKIDFFLKGDKAAETFTSRLKFRAKILNWHNQTSKTFKRAQNYHAVIIDSYHAPKMIYDLLGESHGKRLLILDDYKRYDYEAGIVLNPAIAAVKLKYLKHESVSYLLGPEYCLLREPFWKSSKKIINRNVKSVLINFGATANMPFLKDLITFLNRNFDYRIEIVCPHEHVSSTPSNVHWHSNLSAQDIKKLMMKCDLAISASGQTLFELARVGLPTLAAQIAENQELNLKYFAKNKLVFKLGQYRNTDFYKLLKRGITQLQSYEVRLKLNEKMRQFSTGEGAIKTAGILLENCKDSLSCSLRPVKKSDCRDLWLWRNHKKVREASLNSELISYEDHLSWFQKTLESKKSEIFIMEKSSTKIGQVRFDVDQSNAYISVGLNPQLIGKGFGTRLITKGTHQFLLNSPKVKCILAKILKSNRASIRAFASSNYKLSIRHKSPSDNISIYEYLRRF